MRARTALGHTKAAAGSLCTTGSGTPDRSDRPLGTPTTLGHTKAAAGGLCRTGSGSPELSARPLCAPQDSVSLQVRLVASAGPARALRNGRPGPCVPHRTRSHCRCGWWPVQDQLRLAGLVTRTPACPHRTRPPPQLRLEHAEGAGPGRRTAQTGPCGPAQHSVTLKPQLEASAGPARACQTGRPSPCVPHRTRFHCRCGCRPLQDRLGLSGTVSPAPACPHPTRPPPQLRLEHAEGAGPGRRTARTGPCGPTQHSVTLKPQLAPSARPAWARQTCRTGPWGPPQHLVTLKPQLEASARPSRACQTGRPGPCVPQQDSVKLQQWLQASAGPARAPLNGQPDACVPQQDSVTQQ